MGHTAKSIKQIPRSSPVTNKTDIPTEGKNRAQIKLRILHHSEYLEECMLLDLRKKSSYEQVHNEYSKCEAKQRDRNFLFAIYARQLEPLLGKSPKLSSAEVLVCF